MIIGIDGNEANVEQRVGIGEYGFELLKKFEKFNPPDNDVKFKIYLKKEPREDMPRERNGWEYRIIKSERLWTQFALPFDLYIHKPRPDIFFTPTHYSPRFSPVPTAISIMDVSYIHFPELFKKSDLYQLKNWTSYSVKKASVIFTISKASKSDIIKTYHIEESKIVVTYPGLREKMGKVNNSMRSTKKAFGIRKDYILFVGTLQPRKNITRLIQAFSLLSKQEGLVDTQLVIVGKRGWLYESILDAPKKYSVEDSVLFLDFVTYEELEFLYKNALCLVFPSLYEGFGIPILEAMREGCPVVTSDVSSMPEVGGDSALYVDPEDVEDIASKIKKVIQDEKLRKSMIEKGYAQIKKFSWEKTALETLEVLKKVAEKNER